MNEYMQGWKDIKEIQKTKRDEELLKLDMKEYRKITGKISQLANSTRLNLSYTPLQMSKKNTNATIAHLRDVNRILKKVRERQLLKAQGDW